jgi:hypothetical protein
MAREFKCQICIYNWISSKVLDDLLARLHLNLTHILVLAINDLSDCGDGLQAASCDNLDINKYI